MKSLVSKVSMVTCFLAVTYSRRVGVIHAHLVTEVSMVTYFLGGVDFIWLRFGQESKISMVICFLGGMGDTW